VRGSNKVDAGVTENNQVGDDWGACATAWLFTGDLASCATNENGFFRIVDSQAERDMLPRAGPSSYPGDVEEVCEDYPAIVDAAVIGQTDDRTRRNEIRNKGTYGLFDPGLLCKKIQSPRF